MRYYMFDPTPVRIGRFEFEVTPIGVLIFIGVMLIVLPLLVLLNDWIKRARERTIMAQLTGPAPRLKTPKPVKAAKPDPKAPPPKPPERPRFKPLPPPLPDIPAVPLPSPAPAAKLPPPPPPPPQVEAAPSLPLPEPAGRSAPPAEVMTAKPPVWWVGRSQPGPVAERPPKQMRYRKLGRTGIMVSEVGMGTWSMGGMWGPTNDGESIKAIHRAIDLGVNLIDTALAYGDGHAEQLIGSTLKQRAQPVFVATKVPPKNMEWPARHDVPASEVFPDAWIIACTEVSLRHLERERIDLLQLHVWAPRWLHERDVWLPAIERLKKDGKVRAVGISINDCEPDTALEAVATGLIDTVQVIYNIFEQRPEERLFPACQQHDVGVIVRSPLDEGSLSGFLSADTVFHQDDWRRDYFKGDRLPETVKRVELLRFLVRGKVVTLGQAALRFCLAHPAVSTVIPGMRKPMHVEENCAASDGELLTAEELEQLRGHAWPRNFYASS